MHFDLAGGHRAGESGVRRLRLGRHHHHGGGPWPVSAVCPVKQS